MNTSIIKQEQHETAIEVATLGQQANQTAANYAIADYLSRRASNTVRNHAAALALFADFLDDAGELGGAMRRFAGDVAAWAEGVKTRPDPAAWMGVTWGLLEGFVKWLLIEGYSVTSVNNRLSAVRVYAGLASKAGVIPVEELQLIKAVSGYGSKEAKRVNERRPVTRVGDKKEERVSITAHQARIMKEQDLETAQGRRDALLMCLLLDHGLRVGEVARLQVTDFDLKENVLRFYRPKVDKVQTHLLTPDTLRAARAYFEHDAPAIGRLLLGSRKGGKLTSRPMSERAITGRVQYLGQQLLGLENLSAHDCRHYWATDAARNGTDPFRLQEAGGWSSLAMPRRYVEDARIANQGVRLSQ